MSLLHVRKFTDIAEMEFFLQGGLLGGTQLAPPALASMQGVRSPTGGLGGLVGLVFTVTTPVLSVTFTAGAVPGILSFAELKAQIETAQPLLKVVTVNGRIGLIEASPSSGLTLPATNQQAKILLGFPNRTAVRTYVYGVPSGSAPSFQWAYNANMAGMHVVVTYE